MGSSPSLESFNVHSSTISSNSTLQELPAVLPNMEIKETPPPDFTEYRSDVEKEETDEEIDILVEIFNQLKQNINKIKHIPDIRTKDGNWNGDLVESLSVFAEIHQAIDEREKLHYDDIRKCRREAGQQLSESPTSIMCKVIIDGWRQGYINKDGTINNEEYEAIRLSLSNLHNYSDCTPEVTYDIAGEPNFLETLKLIMTTFLPMHMKGQEKKEDEIVIRHCLGIYHNTSMMDQNISRLRSLEIVPVLNSFLDAKNERYHLPALAALANIIDEQESAILRDKPDVVALLLDTLKLAIQSDKHENKGWSAQECAMAVRRIARNDANKKILVRLHCLQYLVKLAEIGNEEEQREVVGAILVLAFEKDNHNKMLDDKELNTIGVLNKVKKESKDEEIKKAVDKTFWILREELQKYDQYKYIVSSFEQKNRPVTAAKQRGKISGA